MKFSTLILIVVVLALATYLVVMVSGQKLLKDNPELLKLALL